MSMSSLPYGEMIAALGGGGIYKVADLIFGRKSREVASLGEALKILTEQLKSADERMEHMAGRVERVESQHDECQERLSELRAEIDRLMSGRVAAWGEKPPRD